MFSVMFFDESKFDEFKVEYDSLSHFYANIDTKYSLNIQVNDQNRISISDLIADAQSNSQEINLVEVNEAPMARIYDKIFFGTIDEVVKQPNIIHLKRKTDKKMRKYTETMTQILKLTPFVNKLLIYLDKRKLGAEFTENLRFYLAYEKYQMKIADCSNEGYNICLARQLNVAIKACLDPPIDHSPLSNPHTT